MQISLSDYFGLLVNTHKNVLTSLNIDEGDIDLRSDEHNYFTERALIIFKLDKFLFEYKNENDRHRLILKGKNALVSYLVNNKNLSLNEAKNINLEDALILLSNELNSVTIPDEAIRYLQGHDFNFHGYDSKRFIYQYSGYQDSEWEPDLWDKRLLK
ncbi:ECs1072 family phage-associated protein [Serratia marcescens]|uniref:ECs1072 family phage-associated protein n=1 Tax=Serratia marcescens TaxID=615 RepID=UPI002DA6BD9C|nr:hypothetical protein [Serratia marcescens]MEB5609200.1 hypothetical protein [Serratia marcescens]